MAFVETNNKCVYLTEADIPFGTSAKIDRSLINNFVGIKLSGYDANAIDIFKSIDKTDRYYDPATKIWTINKKHIFSIVRSVEALSSSMCMYSAAELMKYCTGAEQVPDSFGLRQDTLLFIKANHDPQPESNPEPITNIETSDNGSEEIIDSLETAIEPITLEYPPYCKKKPYPHQIFGAKVLIAKKKYILADTMGLGKTFTSIIAAYNNSGRVLIVSPASLKLNWRKEIIEFGIPEENITVINSGKTFANAIHSPNVWNIINYELLTKIETVIGSLTRWAKQFTTVIFDEAHYCKAVTSWGACGSQRGECSRSLARCIPNVYLLTGTPITNKPKDLYMLLKMIGSDIAGKWRTFGEYYCNGHIDHLGHWNYDGSSHKDELHQKLKACMLRRKTENVLDLPQKIRSYIPVQVDLADYKAAMKSYFESVNEDESESDDEFCAAAAWNNIKMSLAKSKTKATIEIVKNIVENDKSVVVYSTYVEPAETIANAFQGISALYTGRLNTTQRQDIVDKFQRGEIQVIVCTIAAAGVGITLTRSDTVVFNDFDYTASQMRQAEDRIWRIGQKNSCSILYIYADHCQMDDTLRCMLDEKITTMSEIIDGQEESLVTKKDYNNRKVLLTKLISMKHKYQNASTKEKSKLLSNNI